MERNIRERFLNAVVAGELGNVDDFGTLVTLRDFKRYFSDITTDYANSFLPSCTIEAGRTAVNGTRIVFRVRAGVYRIHPDAIEQHITGMTN